MNEILRSTKYVIDNATFVKINEDRINYFVNEFTHEHILHWLQEAPFNLEKLSETELLNFLLIFNSISFSYWGDPKWSFEYKGNMYDGAWGMIMALGRALEEGYKILDFHYLGSITEKDFQHILRGNITIPLFNERLKILRNIGTTMIEKYRGDFSEILSQSNNVNELRSIIVNEFPFFEDVADYKGEKVFFYKRVQLLLSDIYQMLNNKESINFKNVDELTACADYKLPQILRKLGILEYSEELAKKIDSKQELNEKSEE